MPRRRWIPWLGRAATPAYAGAQVADTGCFHDALERTPDSKIPADLDAIRRQSEVRVGTKVCRDLGRPGFIDI